MKATLKTYELLDIMKANRALHRAAFEKAADGYQRYCIKIFEENIKKLLQNRLEQIRHYETPPSDHTEDYDRAIRMVEMHEDNSMTLDDQDFAQFVLDDWKWKKEWTVSNSKYTT